VSAMATERKPRQVPAVHAVDPSDKRWCVCGRPSLTSGERPCEGLLALAEGREVPSMAAQQPLLPLPSAVLDRPDP
jgi:hypothetical protein